MGELLNLRFRHTQGDIGPLKLPGTITVQATKERLVATWPRDGPLSTEAPTSAADIKLILNGKFLEASETMDSLRPHMGDLKADSIVTLHIIVRAALMSKDVSGKLKGKEESGGCSCSIM